MPAPDLRGLTPAIVTPFDDQGAVDYDSLVSYVSWMKSIPGVVAIVLNSHAGEGSALTADERAEIVRTVTSEFPDLHVVAGIIGDGTRLAAGEAERAAEAGANSVLIFPPPSANRFGFQDGSVQDRFKAVWAASELPIVAFQFPNITKATFTLPLLLELCALDGVFALKDGARDMIRWDVEVPVLRENFPDLQILTCQDEFLLHTMWESDGALVGFGALIPELLVDELTKAKSHDYDAAKAVHDKILPITRAVYHRPSHIESTPAMKLGLVDRGILRSAYVRSPIMPLDAAARDDVRRAMIAAGIELGVPA
jgi:4-hydroxy-tetrahydrodipicolinate synthase